MRSLPPISLFLLTSLLAVAGCGNEHDLTPFGSTASEDDAPHPNFPAPNLRVIGDDEDGGGNDRDPRGQDPGGDEDGDVDDGAGCTYTQGYWKNHEESWPVASLTIGGVPYTAAELDALLAMPTNGDASLILGHQLIAALLNRANGAGTPPAVDTALDSAQQWMAANADGDGTLPYGVHRGDAHGQATSLADTLADYNEGTIGPGHCD